MIPIFLWTTTLALFIFGLEKVLIFKEVPPYLFPLPSKTIQTFFLDYELLWQQFQYSLSEWFLGIVISVVFGVFIAVSAFQFAFIKKIAQPILYISQAVPYLTFAPLLLLWFGLGKTPKVILIVVTCAFPIALMGLRSLEHSKKEFNFLVKILHLNIFDCYKHIYLPASLSGFLAGLKISVSYAFVSAVMSELIGSEAGLGVYLLRAQSSYRIDKVMCCVLVVVCFSLLSTWLVEKLSQKIVFWENRTK